MKMIHGIAATIWIWCILTIVRTSSETDKLSREQQLQLGDYPTEIFDFGTGTRGYSQFLVKLRNRLNATKACDMPVTRETLPAGAEYVLVDLKLSATQFVTLAIQVNNVYLVAFRVGGSTQGTFLKETNVQSAKSKLFDKSQSQPTLPYDSNYDNIEKVGGSRTNLPLGLQDLRKKIEAFYNQRNPVTAADTAKFLLTAIQMVPEAVRYIYIANLVVNTGLSSSFKPDAKMIALETNWGKISKAVHRSNAQVPNQCVTIKPAIVIATETWNLVSEVKINVALLMYNSNKADVASGHSLFSQIVASSIRNAADIAADVGDLDQAFLEDSLM